MTQHTWDALADCGHFTATADHACPHSMVWCSNACREESACRYCVGEGAADAGRKW